MKTVFAIILAVATLAATVSACAPIPCPGSGTWCQNNYPGGDDD